MSLYNLDFDICAIVVYLVVIISYLQKKHVNKHQHYIFLTLLAVAILTPILDIPAAIVIENQADVFWIQLFNCAYYISKELTTFFMLLYVLSQIEFRRHISVGYKICMALPICAMELLILSNPVTGWIFTYNDRIYSRGILRPVIYSVSIFYFIWIFISTTYYKKILNRNFRVLIYTIAGFNIILDGVQYFHSGLLIHSLTNSVGMLLLLVNIERYGMVVDPVTGMAKKEHLDSLLDKLVFNKTPFGLILVHITGYENLALTYGISNAESAVQQVQRSLVTQSESGKAFKISNGTFALIYVKNSDLEKIKETIYQEIKKPFQKDNIEYTLQIVVTSLKFPEQVSNEENVRSYLNQQEKMEPLLPGIYKLEDIHFSDRVREQKVEMAIKKAMRDGGFEVYYQPICTAKEQNFVTAEALLRLTDEELGKIGPDEFIPIAEKTGLILDVGYFVMDSVFSFIEKNNMEELGLKYIELNLSTIQCLQHNFIDIVDEVTYRHHVKPEYVCFEITETAASSTPEIFNQNLKMLNERGYALALDDFGTGYGNLQRMISSDFRIIKFDKNLTQQFSGENDLQKVYRTLQTVIKTMGSDVVSEGVETKEQYEFVRDAGAGYIQGYYFSKPLPSDQFCQFLKEKNCR